MLMEAAQKYRRFRAPQGDGQKLLDPPEGDLVDAVYQNRSRIDAVRQYDLQGRSLGNVIQSARGEFLRAATAYTSQYLDVPPALANSTDATTKPLILSGHQPQLFHPGVWYKNFAAGQLARQVGGIPVHLIIDSDVCRTASILVPAGSSDQPRAEAVALDESADDMPFEERTIQNGSFFGGFAKRVNDVLLPMPDVPIVKEFWPMVVARQKEVRQLGLCLAQGRHVLERAWGNETLEIPVSTVCHSRDFYWFLAHLLAHLPRFWAVYNDALASYRRAHHMRNRAHPVPDLSEADGWLEAPFWVWRVGERERRPLFAKQTGEGILLSDQEGWSVELALSADRDAEAAAQQLADWAGQGLKIRTRALTTTLFARLFLCDLFLHGIGGAKYDQVTDDLFRNFFEFEPPQFATCSATLRLPLPLPDDGKLQLRRAEQQLREFAYHPERHLPSDNQESTSELVAQKLQWIRTPKTHANASQRHQAIVAANRGLEPYLAEKRLQVETQFAQLQAQMRSSAILGSREYSFCLYPERQLKRLLLD